MKNVAIFVKGKPLIGEDKNQFDLDIFEAYDIIKEISIKEGYSFKFTSLENIVNKRGDIYNKEGDIFFYYIGHANGTYIGTKDFKISQVIDFLKDFKGKKYIIIDGCAVDGEFEKHSWPENSKIISGKEIYSNKSIARLLYDSLIARKRNLNELNKSNFDEMKHNWVYFKEVK